MRTRAARSAEPRVSRRGPRPRLHAAGEPAEQALEANAALTVQEERIARLACNGHSNADIGSQLFMSPRTVEHHLAKVFTRLQIDSRQELRRALGA